MDYHRAIHSLLKNFATVYLKDGKIEKVVISNYKKALEIQGKTVPGEPVDFKMDIYDLSLSKQQIDEEFQKAEISVINNNTKEIEKLNFEKEGSLLFAQVPTEESKATFHYDVLVLILLFGASMYLAQKVMTATSKSVVTDPQQKAMQESMAKMMPIMITGMFIFFPIPAGVLLYMIVSNIIQIVQSARSIKCSIKEEEQEKDLPAAYY